MKIYLSAYGTMVLSSRLSVKIIDIQCFMSNCYCYSEWQNTSLAVTACWLNPVTQLLKQSSVTLLYRSKKSFICNQIKANYFLSHNLRSRSAGTQHRKSNKCTSAISIFVSRFSLITLLQTGHKWHHLWWCYYKQRHNFAEIYRAEAVLK